MTTRLAIAGTGAMAEYHYKKFSAIPGLTVPVCGDHRVNKAHSFAEKFGIGHWFDSIDTLLDQAGDEIDAVSCAVVDSHHARIALSCLRRGLPLFCEKPMTRTLAEAEAVLAAATAAATSAAAAGRAGAPIPVVVNFSKRNAPALAALAAVVREGRLGRILDIDASYRQGWLVTGAWGDWRTALSKRWRLSPTESTGGMLGDLGSHLLDAVLAMIGTADSLVGAPVLDSAMSFPQAYAAGLVGTAEDRDDPLVNPESSPPGESACPALVDFSAHAGLAGGGQVRIGATCIDSDAVDDFVIKVTGDRGEARLDFGISRDSISLRTARGDETLRGPAFPSTYQAFIELVRGSAALAGTWSCPSLTQGLAVQRLLEALMDGARATCPGTRSFP